MIVFRNDVDSFNFGLTGELVTALASLPDNCEVWVNDFGNLAIAQWQATDRSTDNPDKVRDTSRYYVGYYDMVQGQLHVALNTRYNDTPPPPGHPAQSWMNKTSDGSVEQRYTRGEGGEMQLSSLATHGLFYDYTGIETLQEMTDDADEADDSE